MFSWVKKRRRSNRQPHGPKVQWPNLCSSALVYGLLGGAVLLILRKFVARIMGISLMRIVLLILRKFVYNYKAIIYMIVGMS